MLATAPTSIAARYGADEVGLPDDQWSAIRSSGMWIM